MADDVGLRGLRPRVRTRRVVLIAAAAVALLLILEGARYWRLNAGLVKTDNAQTAGDLAPISSRIPGTVIKVSVNENDFVKAGTALVELDPTDYRLALAHAKAELAAARSQVEANQAALAAQSEQFRAAVEVARAALSTAAPHLSQAQAQLRMTGRTSPAQIAQARAQVTTADANVRSAKADLDTANRTMERDRMLLAQGAISTQQAATAAVEVATVNLARTGIRAPEDGWVTNRTVQIGQVIQPNQPLLSLALANHVWVVANIKETQLGRIHVGDHVRITVDAIRGRPFRGHVESIGAATGSSTALLPPDNATGNFIKVVQLVPVRIALDFGPESDPPLQIGLSCEVAIDTRTAER